MAKKTDKIGLVIHFRSPSSKDVSIFSLSSLKSKVSKIRCGVGGVKMAKKNALEKSNVLK
jgi:hypothetical protein